MMISKIFSICFSQSLSKLCFRIYQGLHSVCFHGISNPRAEEFILSISSVNIYNDDVRETLSNDKSFMNVLRETKDHFDWACRQIISYPDFVFWYTVHKVVCTIS